MEAHCGSRRGQNARQAWTRRDLTALGALALVAALAIAAGVAGAARLQPIAGLALILAIAYCFSAARHAIDYRTVAWGLTLQGLFAVSCSRPRPVGRFFSSSGR